MSFGADEEILQDFLVEAGEILEQLSEQLVELESRPDDADLLNAIFRGFHTVKGAPASSSSTSWWSAVTSPRTCSTSCARVSVASTRN